MNNNDFNIYNNYNNENFSSKRNKSNLLPKIIKKSIVYFLIIVIIFCTALLITNQVITNNKVNSDYLLDISIPEIIYMNEPVNISGYLKGKDQDVIERTTTEISTIDNETVSFSEESFFGKDIATTITPLKEGHTEIYIITITEDVLRDGGKRLAEITKKVTVCPQFNSNLLEKNNITISKGDTYKFKINFGEKECGYSIDYKSSNKNIMTVTNNGVIIGINKGTAEIIITKDNKKIVANVTVK